MLYRVFPYDPVAQPGAFGTATYVPRLSQGTGRHDNPEHYGALYLSRSPESAVAERIKPFRGRAIGHDHLQRADGTPYALAAFDDFGLKGTVDLDDPRQLVKRGLKSSEVATGDRSTTRPLALGIFDEGLIGFGWWSTLEASWANVTLFAERAVPMLTLAEPPELLQVTHPVLRTAAEAMGVRLIG